MEVIQTQCGFPIILVNRQSLIHTYFNPAMSEEIKIQFYIFNQDHFAIPIESAENGDNLRFWKPTIDLISQIVDCKIIANSVPDWLNGTTNSEKWELSTSGQHSPFSCSTDMKDHRETYKISNTLKVDIQSY